VVYSLFDADLLNIAPDLTDDGAEIDRLLRSIQASATFVERFVALADVAAGANDSDTIHGLFGGLSLVADRYTRHSQFKSGLGVHQFDFFRFIGHELMVGLVAATMRRRRWQILASLLKARLRLRNDPRGEAGFDYLGVGSVLLASAGVAGRKRRSEQARVLRSRYGSATALGRLVPFDDFMAADYLLFLRTVLNSEGDGHGRRWFPPSVIFLRNPPLFLVEARETDFDSVLANVLGTYGSQHFWRLVTSRARLLAEFFPNEDVDPLRDFSIPVVAGPRRC
jgi:hypothetical protein